MSSSHTAENNHTILIIDDNLDNLELLSDMMKVRNYAVKVADNGSDALILAMKSPPDLILLDINMPDMDGYAVCDRLKRDARTRDIPVIFISALALLDDKIKAFTNGGVDYITKPFQVQEVLARVQTHMKLRVLQKQLELRVRELEAALAKVQKLEELLPICLHCKRVQNRDGVWMDLDVYIDSHTATNLDRSICPDCESGMA